MQRFRSLPAEHVPRATACPRGLLGPAADEVFAPLTSPRIKQRVKLAHLVTQWRTSVQKHVARPAGRVLLRRWMNQKAGAACIETLGLPRHIVDEVMGDEALTLHVNPRKLIRMAVYAPRDVEKRPSSMAFIWDGDWDLRREDLRVGSRYLLISDLDRNRNNPERTERFQALMACIENGKPWGSHQLGILLDTPEKILAYLRNYLGFLDDMGRNGFDPSRGKDSIGVAVSRDGTLLKVNRGLHRLAMAQRLGLPSIPVRVRHVHRDWWNEVTDGYGGAEALEKMQEALQACVPEEAPGPLDEPVLVSRSKEYWPALRT